MIAPTLRRLEDAEHLCEVLRPDRTGADELLDALNRFAESTIREAVDIAKLAHQLTPHPEAQNV